jgi:hypothetical protein
LKKEEERGRGGGWMMRRGKSRRRWKEGREGEGRFGEKSVDTWG